ncbi:TonB-dependent receptor [Mucilaginibacter sp.]
MQKSAAYSYLLLWRKPACLFLLAITSTIPLKLLAQTDTTKKLNEVKVVSSVTGNIQNITSAQSISSNDFIRYNAFNVADVIRDFSGVIIKDYGGIGGLKTVSVRGLSANHTAILYDGVALEDAETGQIDLSQINLTNIQKIVLYNAQPPDICMPAQAFASASVIAITTVKPRLTELKSYLITAGLKTGSFGLVNPYLQWQQRINKNWSFIVNGYTENANGQYKFKGATNYPDSTLIRRNSDIAAQQFDGALYWAKNDSNKFNLHINYYNSDRGLPGAVIYNATPSNQRLWNQDFFAQAGYERIWNNGFELLLNAKASRSYLRYLNPQFDNIEGSVDQHFTQRELYQSVALAYHILKTWEVSYAVDATLNDLRISFNYPDPTFPNPTRFTLLNLLASNLVLGKLRIEGNILNTNITETVKTGQAGEPRNIYSPTLIATLLPFADPGLQFRAFYKNIFRNPTFDDLYYQQVGNPNLKPENTDQYDLGATYFKTLTGFFKTVSATADAYYNDVTNKIVFFPSNLFPGSIVNYGKVDIEGLDLGLKTQAKLSENAKWLLSLNYSYQKAQNVTDPTASIYLNQLPYTPKNTVALNTGIDYKYFGVYYNQIISSSRYYTNDNLPYDYIPGYSVSDASASCHFLKDNKPVTVSFEVNNLFNNSYYIVRSYPMPSRSYRISLQITI